MPVPQQRGRRGLVATVAALVLAGGAHAAEPGTQEGGVAGPNPSSEVTRANALAAAGHREEAIALLELHVSTNPQDALAKQSLLSLRIAAMEEEIRRILGEQAKAKELVVGDPDYESARARADAAVSKRLDIAEYYAHNRKYPEAAMVCNAILKDYPHHPAALKLKYRILTEMVERERAELLKDRALRREDVLNDTRDDWIAPGELPKSKRSIFVFDEDVAEIERAELKKRLQQRVDLIYDGTNGTKSAQVREVLQPLFAIAGINYVILDSALGTETLTIHLVHETIETALATISKLVNIRYNYAGGTVFISSATSDVLVTEIIRVHSGLTDVVTEPQLGANDFGGGNAGGGGGGNGQPGVNTPFGGGAAGMFGGAGGGAGGGGQQGGGQQFVSDLERFLEQVPDIVVGWPAEGKIYLDKKSNTVYVRSTPHTIQEVKRLLQALDYNSTQVLIEARFIEVSDSGAKELGVDWAGGGKNGDAYLSGPTTGLTPPTASDGGATIGTTFGNISGIAPATAGGMFAQVLVAPSDYLKFKAQISALEQNGKADTLSEPKILTLNNAVGVIEVRKDISYVSSYQNAGYNNQPYYPNNPNNGNVYNPGYNYSNATLVPQFTKDYEGISLKIRPSVARNSDIITLGITPTVRELIKAPANFAFSNPGGGNSEQPVTNNVQSPPEFDTRRLVTALHVKNGGTVILGGLSREREQTNTTGVPFLSRVPVVGSLFRRDSANSRRSNLMIFVTAHIIDPRGAKQGDEIQHLRDTARVLLPSEVAEAEKNSAAAAAKEAAEPEAQPQPPTGPIWRRDRRR
jgi:type II secretory pathway component GspD/PulD (secretin)